mgnify:CR=1 FL=1
MIKQEDTSKLNECEVCGQAFKGRTDKKFCSEGCKSIHHYELKKQKERRFLAVERQLKTNRKILKKYNQTGMTSLRREVITTKGFNPAYYTHTWQNQRGQTYYFSYDLGILPLEDRKGGILKNKFLIVEWQDYMQAKPPFR